MNDEKFPWMGKKLIQRAGNDHIHIQKQGRAAQAVPVSRKSRQLGPARAREYPAANPAKGWANTAPPSECPGRYRSGGTKVEITFRQVPPHHGVQAINVPSGPYLVPVHAQNVALRLASGQKASERANGLVMAELRAFFQRLGRGFLRTLDRTTCREALVAQHTHLLDRGLGARAAKLEQLHIAGACFAVFVEGFRFFWLRRHSTSNLPIC